MQFQTTQDLTAHYKAVANRLRNQPYNPPVKPVVENDPPPVEPKKLLPEEFMATNPAKTFANAQRLIATVCHKHNLEIREIFGCSRLKPVVAARREACWWIIRRLKFSYYASKDIMQMDHTSVMHHVRRFEELNACLPA